MRINNNNCNNNNNDTDNDTCGITVPHNCYGKVFLLTANSISPRKNQLHHFKINFATAKSLSLKAKSFLLAFPGDINSQSAMGVNPT